MRQTESFAGSLDISRAWICRTVIGQNEMDDSCSFSPGEKVRLRASQEHYLQCSEPARKSVVTFVLTPSLSPRRGRIGRRSLEISRDRICRTVTSTPCCRRYFGRRDSRSGSRWCWDSHNVAGRWRQSTRMPPVACPATSVPFHASPSRASHSNRDARRDDARNTGGAWSRGSYR
jgi:hypothetical protein